MSGTTLIAGLVSGSNSPVPVQVDANGKVLVEITAEGLALDVSVDGLEAGIGTAADAATTTTAAGSNNAMLRQLKNIAYAAFTPPATATQTSVNSVTTAGGVSILASNAARLGATITNTDANVLYLYFGATGTVSSSVYNFSLSTGQTLVLNPGEYTGVITGIWAADGSGAAKVCEFSI